jgi:LacI family transcriptional regulator
MEAGSKVGPTPGPKGLKNRVTLREVAHQAGVHVSTASRALNPRTRSIVNAETVERVLTVAANLDYRPNPLARGLRTNQTMSVGMVIPDIDNPLFGAIIAGVEQRLGADGYSLLIANTDPQDTESTSIIDTLVERRVDGMILATAFRDDADVRHLTDRGIPVVLVNRTAEGASVPAIVGDDQIGVGLAVRHLTDLGHRKIGHVAGPLSLSTGLGRREAFLDWTRRLGLLDPPVEEAEWFRLEPGYRAARRLLERRPDLTAVLCANDLLALGAYQAVREAGYEVGAGISVTGYNDVPLMEFMQPPMTAVRIPYRKMGMEAAEALLRLFAGDRHDAKIIIALEPTLSVRASTAPPRA